MKTHLKLSTKGSTQAAASSQVAQQRSTATMHMTDNRADEVAQRRLQSIAENTLQKFSAPGQEAVAQRVLHHFAAAPFTAEEAEQWNALVEVAEEFEVAADFIESVESDVWDAESEVTVTGSLGTLRGHIRDAILTRQRDRTDADSLGWGDFAPMLAELASLYGTRTGSVSTGGHASDTYTYTTDDGSVSLAEETDAHGQTAGNLNTRRGQMRTAIDLFNDAVQAHADQYA